MASKKQRVSNTEIESKPMEQKQDNGYFIPVGIFKTNDAAYEPTYATPGSSCFDLYACLTPESSVIGYTKTNEKINKRVAQYVNDSYGIVMEPGERVLVPSGLIFDLPENTTLKLYPRSGMSLKQGAKLANCTGIVDADYVEETFAMIENDSAVRITILHGDRICQGEVSENPPKAKFSVASKRPAAKTIRNGGFGSTGQ